MLLLLLFLVFNCQEVRQEHSKYLLVISSVTSPVWNTLEFCSNIIAEGPGAILFFNISEASPLKDQKGQGLGPDQYSRCSDNTARHLGFPVFSVSGLHLMVQTCLCSPATMDWFGIYLYSLGLWFGFLVHIFILIHDVFHTHTLVLSLSDLDLNRPHL